MSDRIISLTSARLKIAEAVVAMALGAIVILKLVGFAPASPGVAIAQVCAIIGTLLCFVPVFYTVVKRGGFTREPPRWFALHVLCVLVGCVFIGLHVASGDWLSPPGLLLIALVFLVLQGSYAYRNLTAKFSVLFGRSGQGFIHAHGQLNEERRNQLRAIIDAKRALLPSIDASADEALFSPHLMHWLRHPVRSLRYQRLADAEARLVGARQRAGWVLSLWRRIHMLVAALFVIGVLIHIVVVVFFAGYVADARDIDWWHIIAWGGG